MEADAESESSERAFLFESEAGGRSEAGVGSEAGVHGGPSIPAPSAMGVNTNTSSNIRRETIFVCRHTASDEDENNHAYALLIRTHDDTHTHRFTLIAETIQPSRRGHGEAKQHNILIHISVSSHRSVIPSSSGCTIHMFCGTGRGNDTRKGDPRRVRICLLLHRYPTQI